MKTPKQPHQDQHIHDGIWQEFVEEHNEKPILFFIVLVTAFMVPLMGMVYTVKSVDKLFFSIAIYIVIACIFVHFVFPRCCKQVVTRIPKRRQRYLEKNN